MIGLIIFGLIISVPYGINTTNIESCLMSINATDFEGLNRLEYSNAVMLNTRLQLTNDGYITEGGTGLFKYNFNYSKIIISLNNPDSCLILRHELCHLKQWRNGDGPREEGC